VACRYSSSRCARMAPHAHKTIATTEIQRLICRRISSRSHSWDHETSRKASGLPAELSCSVISFRPIPRAEPS
jgi:hypothetical protein